MDCPRSFKHQKIRKGWNMPIYCHFWYKSEYQFDNYLIKHVVFSALSKNVSPPFSMTIPRSRQGGFREKETQLLLRWKVVLRYHRTKSHVSVFLKRDGNMQFHVSVIFTSRGNVKTQVLSDSVTFPERKLPSHVSAMFKLADFRYCAFPSCFWKRIFSCLLHLPKHKR